MKQNSDQIRHLQRKLFLVSKVRAYIYTLIEKKSGIINDFFVWIIKKERDACREIMDNYSKECTIVIPSGQENERVKKLETILDGYKRTVENLETDLKSAHEKLNKFGHQSSVSGDYNLYKTQLNGILIK